MTNAERWAQREALQKAIDTLVRQRDDISRSMVCECFPEDQQPEKDDYNDGTYCNRCGYMVTRKYSPQ